MIPLAIENGGYVVVNLVTMYAMFLPIDRRFSVDAWLGLSVPSVVAEGLAVLVVLSLINLGVADQRVFKFSGSEREVLP